jgi:hypothetical protein
MINLCVSKIENVVVASFAVTYIKNDIRYAYISMYKVRFD